MIELHKFLLLYSKDTDKFWSDIQSIIEKYNLSASFLGYCVPDEYKKAYVKTYYAKYNKNSYINLRNDFNNNVVNALNEYFEYVVDKEINFFNMDFQDFIYLDSPYLITSSEYNKLKKLDLKKVGFLALIHGISLQWSLVLFITK